MSERAIKVTMSIAALAVAALHVVRPTLAIDGVTAILLAIALLPWLSSLFKSIELPGGIKVEYRDLERIEERARESGLLEEGSGHAAPEFAFQAIASRDPNLALAGLRIELEKRLAQLAESRGLAVPRAGLSQLLKTLNESQLIGRSERELLSDLAGLLNGAVHGATVEPSAAQWALDIGPEILDALDRRIDSPSIRYEGIS